MDMMGFLLLLGLALLLFAVACIPVWIGLRENREWQETYPWKRSYARGYVVGNLFVLIAVFMGVHASQTLAPAAVCIWTGDENTREEAARQAKTAGIFALLAVALGELGYRTRERRRWAVCGALLVAYGNILLLFVGFLALIVRSVPGWLTTLYLLCMIVALSYLVVDNVKWLRRRRSELSDEALMIESSSRGVPRPLLAPILIAFAAVFAFRLAMEMAAGIGPQWQFSPLDCAAVAIVMGAGTAAGWGLWKRAQRRMY